MKGLGRLLTALNPLDQAALSQASKLGGDATWQRLMGAAKGIAKGFNPRGYFKGLHRTTEGAGWGGEGWVKGSAESRRRLASQRKTGAIGMGVWGGLNMIDPDSGGTRAVNTAAFGVGYAAGMPAAKSLAAKFGGAHAGKLSGGYKIAGGAFLANRILGIV